MSRNTTYTLLKTWSVRLLKWFICATCFSWKRWIDGWCTCCGCTWGRGSVRGGDISWIGSRWFRGLWVTLVRAGRVRVTCFIICWTFTRTRLIWSRLIERILAAGSLFITISWLRSFWMLIHGLFFITQISFITISDASFIQLMRTIWLE